MLHNTPGIVTSIRLMQNPLIILKAYPEKSAHFKLVIDDENILYHCQAFFMHYVLERRGPRFATAQAWNGSTRWVGSRVLANI